MTILDLIGYLAGACIVGSMIPQMIKSWKTKSTKDISILRYAIYIVGVILWSYYSVAIRSNPMIISNSIALFFAFSILYMKIKYG